MVREVKYVDRDLFAGVDSEPTREDYYTTSLRAGSKPAKPSKNAGFRNRNLVHELTKPRHKAGGEIVVGFLSTRGAHGATREEIAIGLNMPVQTVCARVRELLDESTPVVIETDAKRPTRTGSPAVVLQHVFAR
jgi:hypothetical protein